MTDFLNISPGLKVPPNFLAKIQIGAPHECWTWTGAITSAGYGSFGYEGRRRNASQLAYIFAKGEIPAGLEVMHSCDNRRCCNPAHLSVGTRSQNMRDCVARDRAARMAPSKYTKEIQRQIAADYAAGISVEAISEKYGCHKVMATYYARKFGVPTRMPFYPRRRVSGVSS